MVYPSSSAESLSQSLSRLYSQDEADLNESGRSVNSPFFQEGNSSELSEDEEHTNVVSSSSAVGAAAVGPNARFKAVTIGMIAAQKRAKKPQVQVNSSDYLLPTDMEVAVWKAVAGKIALAEENKDLNVNIRTVVHALESAIKYYATSMDCRTFVTDNLHDIVEILLYKSNLGLNTTMKDDLGLSESDYAQKAIRFAVQLINADVKKNAHKFTIHCETLDVLALILSCKDSEASMEMRMDKILAFQRNKGFYHLAVYINARCGTKAFPYWELVHHVLDAILDGILHLKNLEDEVVLLAEFRKAAMNTIVGVMKHMSSLDAKALGEIDASMIANIISSLSALSEDLASFNCKALSNYSTFCQDGVIKLQSSSTPSNHKLLGTELLQNLIQTILGTRPLAKSLLVKGAGLGLGACNGIYTISPTCLDRDGFVIPGLYPRYERHVPESNEKFILFMRMDPTSKDYWVLSEAQEEDRLIDVYANVPECICYIPPSLGWVCLDKYNNPAPTLKPLDEMVPIRDEHLALKHDLAKWFVENIAVQLNDSSSPSDSVSINKLVEAIDSSQEDITPDKIAALVMTIKPESSTPPPLPARQMSLESKDETPVVSRAMSSESVVSRVISSESIPSALETGPSAIEAAKLSVASSERWLEVTQKMLATAQQEHDAAYEMVARAREYLAALEKKEGMKRKDGEKDVRRSAQLRSSRVQKKGEKNEIRSSMKNFRTRIFRTHS